jgi:hypothetical protein
MDAELVDTIPISKDANGVYPGFPQLTFVRAQDFPEVAGRDDLVLLRFATAEDRVVVTHDLSTMIPAMRERLRLASRGAPIVFVPDSLPVSAAIEDLLLLDECAEEGDGVSGVIYLPLR